jgi:hypothetical protein
VRRIASILSILIALMALVGLAGPVLAAGPGDIPTTGRVVFVTGGDVEIPAGDQADAVVVIQGDARVAGTVTGLVVVDGTATLTGATVDSVLVVSGTVDVGEGARVLGDVAQVNGTVVRSGGVIEGETRDLALGLATLGMAAGAIALVAWVGVGLATLISGLVLVTFAGRQVRQSTELIRRQPGMVTLLGVVSLLAIPLVAALAMATVIGIPMGLGIVVVVWPALAFLGYLVGATSIGEWLLSRRAGYRPADRPRTAAALGLVIAFVLGIIPLVSVVISIIGTGAVIRAAWYTWRGERPADVVARPRPMPA